jgi:hypothetical protein
MAGMGEDRRGYIFKSPVKNSVCAPNRPFDLCTPNLPPAPLFFIRYAESSFRSLLFSDSFDDSVSKGTNPKTKANASASHDDFGRQSLLFTGLLNLYFCIRGRNQNKVALHRAVVGRPTERFQV